MRGERVLVTGGAGFIGSNLAEALAEENDVVILDDLSTGKLEKIKNLKKKNNVQFIKGRITDDRLLHKCFSDIDYVFHQAALPSVPRSIKDPQGSNEVNISGTLNVLIAARDCNVKKVVCASSSSVYGDTPSLPKMEDMPVDPLSPYAVTKATGEFYCKVFHELYGLKTASLRYFNVFGPRQDPNSQYAAVIPKFINAIMNNEPPVIFGDGEQNRDFSYIKHVVDANILACGSDRTGIFNIACGRRITINQLVDMINEILGKDIEPVYQEPRPGDIKHSLADISKARTFGYEPESDFKEELRETIRWFSNGSI
ncbi:MAG: SDR family oxidoreductase [Euryarchaeota archaeon]|nr:SDR family oxidoreductase [Euryarchaeota archaeon]MCG2735860.1 SDR family oxidoreductase [Candidatus Methanoperedenaceae archaeon]